MDSAVPSRVKTTLTRPIAAPARVVPGTPAPPVGEDPAPSPRVAPAVKSVGGRDAVHGVPAAVFKKPHRAPGRLVTPETMPSKPRP
jgi:hypothetical protein